MKFTCDKCGAHYAISDDKVGTRGVRVRCKKCSNVIVLRPAVAETGAAGQETLEARTQVLAAGGGGGWPLRAVPDGVGDADDDELDAALGALGRVPSLTSRAAPPEDEADEAAPADETAAAPQAKAPAPENAAEDPRDPAVPEAEAIAPATAARASGGDRIDAEIGAAFDQLFGGDGGDARESVEEDAELDQAFGAVASGEDPDQGGGAFDAPQEAPAGAFEWYVALGDQQVGPLGLDEVQAYWDAGDLMAESLVWRSGFPDWVPLANVAELRDVLAPRREAAAPEAPAMMAAPPPAETAPAPTWKPEGASLLASLAAEEMKALDRQADEPTLAGPRHDPVAPAAAAEAPVSPVQPALGLDLPPPPDSTTPAPEETPAAPVFAQTAPMPVRERRQVTTAAASAGWMTPGRLLAAVGGAAAFAVVLVMGALWAAGVFARPEAAEPVAAADAGVPAVAAATNPEVLAPAPEAAPAEAPASPEAEPSEAVAGKTPPTEEEAAATAAEEKPAGTDGEEQVAAAAPAKPAAAPAPKPAPRRTVARRTSTREAAPKPAPKPAPTRAAAPAPDPFADDASDLEAELFGASTPPTRAAAPSAPASQPSGYIPPPAGTKDLPKSLGQGDIAQVVVQHKADLKACADRQKASGGPESGQLWVSWEIQPDGRTRNVRCTTPELADSVMCSCAKEVFSKMRFPPFGGPEPQTGRMPLSF